MREGKGRTTNFREFNDAELARLSDEELVAYVRKARRAGKPDAAVKGAQVLAFRYEPRIEGFVYGRIRDLGEPVCDEVVERTLESAIRSAGDFQGDEIEEFGGWIFRIARRRLADMHRERKRRPAQVPDTIRGEDGEDFPGEHGTEDPHGAVDAASVVRQVLESRNEQHRLVIELGLFTSMSHEEIAAEVERQMEGHSDDPMTDQNVAQILSRFHRDVRKALAEAEDPPTVDDDD